MKSSELATLAAMAAAENERDVWLALIRATFAVAAVSRLGWASRHVLGQVSEHFGLTPDDACEQVAALPRERVRAFAVCVVGALLCGDALRREAFVRAFGADPSAAT